MSPLGAREHVRATSDARGPEADVCLPSYTRMYIITVPRTRFCTLPTSSLIANLRPTEKSLSRTSKLRESTNASISCSTERHESCHGARREAGMLKEEVLDEHWPDSSPSSASVVWTCARHILRTSLAYLPPWYTPAHTFPGPRQPQEWNQASHRVSPLRSGRRSSTARGRHRPAAKEVTREVRCLQHAQLRQGRT